LAPFKNEKIDFLDRGLTSVPDEEEVPNREGTTCTMDDAFSASDEAQSADRGRLQVSIVSPIVTNPSMLT